MNTKDPRQRLSALIAALEAHYDVTVQSGGEDDERIDVAAERLSEAFEAYDDALFDTYGVATPFVLFDDEDMEDEDDLDDDFDDFDDLDDVDDDEDE